MKYRVFAFVLALCLLVSCLPAALAGEYTAQERYQILRELETLIREDGLESSPDDDPLGRALIALMEKDPALYGQLMALMLSGYDPYSRYVSAGTYGQIYGGEESYVGIGVSIRSHAKGALIETVAFGGPADRAGLRMQDVICALDGTDLMGMPLQDISGLLQGDAGTQVTLTVLRGSEKLTVTLSRQSVDSCNYYGTALETDIYYMRWSRIAGETDYLRYVMDLRAMQKRGDRCLILDLRGNPGGELNLAFNIIDRLLDEKLPFFETVHRDQITGELVTDQIESTGDGISIPHIFILMDKNTASAAEIIAAGLRDTGRAITIGESTYGKACAQVHIRLKDDSAIVLTTMALRSLKAGDYQDKGLTPDVPVRTTLQPGEDLIRVPEGTPLALNSCSDNAELLNRALAALGALEALPEKPYRITGETLEACRLLEGLVGAPRTTTVVTTQTLRLINEMLGNMGQGIHLRDDQLNTALELARAALKE